MTFIAHIYAHQKGIHDLDLSSEKYNICLLTDWVTMLSYVLPVSWWLYVELCVKAVKARQVSMRSWLGTNWGHMYVSQNLQKNLTVSTVLKCNTENWSVNVELCVKSVKPSQARSQCKAGMEQSHSEDKENTLKHKGVQFSMCIYPQGTHVCIHVCMNVPF